MTDQPTTSFPAGQRHPVERPGQEVEMREQILRIGRQAARTTDNEFKAEKLREIVLFLDPSYDVAGKTKAELTALIKSSAREIEEHEAALRAKENEDEWSPPAESLQSFSEEKENEDDVVFAYRCLQCGQHPVVFKPGFDPRNPGTDSDGNVLRFPFWPFKYRAWEHVSAAALRVASRERPVCGFCSSRIPLFQGGRFLPGRGIVAFTDVDLREQVHELPSVKLDLDPNLR